MVNKMKNIINKYAHVVTYDYLIDAFNYSKDKEAFTALFKEAWGSVWENWESMTTNEFKELEPKFADWVQRTFPEDYPAESLGKSYPFKLIPEVYFAHMTVKYGMEGTPIGIEPARVINKISHLYNFKNHDYYLEDTEANEYYHAVMMAEEFAVLLKKDTEDGTILKAIPSLLRLFLGSDREAVIAYRWYYYQLIAEQKEKNSDNAAVKLIKAF